jgi:hypothetical protein
MNSTHQKLAEKMSREIKKQFPEVEITGIGPAWGDAADAWIHIKFPSDHIRELEVRDFAAELSTKYLGKHKALILPVSGAFEVPSPAGR